MSNIFQKVGVFGKTSDQQTRACINQLISYLSLKQRGIFVEAETLQNLDNIPSDISITSVAKEQLSKHCELVIIVGGDGSLLNAARALVDDSIPVLGIHRGRLGFLTDIAPHNMENALNEIFDNKYQTENRSLLSIQTKSDTSPSHKALNDIVIYNGDIARLIEFEIYIDGHYVVHQRSDGLIISTPTGSTAYALSGGGPILYPTLPNFLLVPMFAHTLSARPIVINEDSEIAIVISAENTSDARVSCDGQVHFTASPSEELVIKKYPKSIQLIHPQNYNYFSVLREKLGWNVNSSSDRYPQKSFS